MEILKNKNIVLAVSGSISAFKAVELSRLFYKAGANVRVIMSESAKKFVTPLTFEALTQNKVLDDTNEDWSNDFNHIGMAKWADLFVIAPATANTIAKLANAIADNILLQTALAYEGVKILAPSANTAMIKHMWPELLTEPLNPHLWKHYYATKLKLYWLFRWLKKGW